MHIDYLPSEQYSLLM